LKLLFGLSAFGRFPEMLHAGVNVCLATDAPAAGNYSDMIRVMYLASVIFKDARHDPTLIPAETAIEMATINGAKAVGMENEIGSIEIGKKADMVIVDMGGIDWHPRYDPIQNLVYSSAGNSIQTVIIDGKLVMENRELKTVDEERTLAKIRELADGIVERSGVNPINTRWKIV
jgi:cytosine/adenosine deaminase-related metal-dependent hydrolase